MKEFYKMKLFPSEEGLMIYEQKFICFRETECIYWCVAEQHKAYLSSTFNKDETTLLKKLKKHNVRVFRINKSNSRIAFETKEKAFDHLLLLKRKQLAHMQRDIKILNAFLSFGNDNKFLDLDFSNAYFPVVPDTRDICLDNFLFD